MNQLLYTISMEMIFCELRFWMVPGFTRDDKGFRIEAVRTLGDSSLALAIPDDVRNRVPMYRDELTEGNLLVAEV
jgi:hypothetical protein